MRREGAISLTIDATVAFHDVDMVQVVWHGHYLKYFENARWALMEHIGFGMDVMRASGYGWPVTELHVKYVQPARFGDQLQIRASLIEWQNRLITNYLVTHAVNGERLARAQTVQVAVDAKTLALQFATPRALLDCVETYLRAPAAGTS